MERWPGHHYAGAPPPASRLGGARGFLRTRSYQGCSYKLCACAGAAQNMFSSTSGFNQPVAAWGVGQVTDMQVRRCPASQDQGLLRTQLPRRPATSRACVLVAAQGTFSYARRFNQPVAAWDVGQVTDMQVRRRPASQDRGLLRTQLPRRSGHTPYVCAGATQSMFSNAAVFNQPVEAWDVGQVASMSVRRSPRRD